MMRLRRAYAVGFCMLLISIMRCPVFTNVANINMKGTVESVYLTDGMTVEVIADGIHLPATDSKTGL